MINVQSLMFKGSSREELLPDFRPDFPYLCSYVEFDQWIGRQVPWHWHKEVELFYVEQGLLEYNTPGGTAVFPAGSGGLVSSNVLHATKALAKEEETVQMEHIFDTSLIGGSEGSLLEQKYILPIIDAPQIEILRVSPDTKEGRQFLKLLGESFTLPPDQFGYELELRSVLSKLWCMLMSISKPLLDQKRSNTESDEKIKAMMKYIQEHSADKLTISDIAASVFVSERECFRIFRLKLNMTPLEYIKSIRIRQACAMLTDSSMSISYIGQACGLGSSSYFGRTFRETMGCTPREYRRNWRDLNTKEQESYISQP